MEYKIIQKPTAYTYRNSDGDLLVSLADPVIFDRDCENELFTKAQMMDFALEYHAQHRGEGVMPFHVKFGFPPHTKDEPYRPGSKPLPDITTPAPWEYILRCSDNFEDELKCLSYLGKQGWELVSSVVKDNCFWTYFKRRP